MAPKRQRKGKKTQAHQAKRKKCEDTSIKVDEAVNDAIKPTKITDINIDCLQHIFNYLSVIDLLNVCDASKRFGDAVEQSFKSRRHHRVKLKDIAPSRNQLIEVCWFGAVTIFDLTSCFKYLRSFGHTINTLTIDYNGIAQNHCTEVDRYISEYCGDTLQFIYLHHAKPYSMDNLTKRFSEVKIVDFYNCELSNHLTNFEKLFPKMFSLQYHGVNKGTDSKCFSQRIPRLTDLTIELVTKEEDEMQIGMLKLAETLRLNPQISDLTIKGPGLDAKGLQSIGGDLQKVTLLDLCVTRNFFNLKRGTINLKNITSLRLHFDYSTTEIPKIPLSCQRLKELTISAGNKLLNDNILNFIGKQKSLKILKLPCHKSSVEVKNTINDVRLEKVLRSFEILSLNCELSTDEIIMFLDKLNMLKKFDFILNKNSNVECLKERLPAKWRIRSIYDNCLFGKTIYLEFNNLEP